MKNTLVVLAAGIGSRYGGLKQMDPVGPSGEFLLDYSVYDALRGGFERVVFVISRAIEDAFKASIGRRIGAQVEVTYVTQSLTALPAGFRLPPERKKPWGTGHAVLCCRDAIEGPFAVINADDFYGRNAFAVLSRFLGETADQPDRYAMVGYRLGNTVSEHGSVARGICRVNRTGALVEVVERTKIEKTPRGIQFEGEDGTGQPLRDDDVASMNFWGFKPSFFDALQSEFTRFLEDRGQDPKAEFFVPSVVNFLLAGQGIDVQVLETDSPWFGVTYPEDRPRVAGAIRSLVEAGEYPENLWACKRG